MNFLVTGGNRGLGKYICEQEANSKSVSRSSGYDIIQAAHRVEIAKQSLDYDVFINNAFDGPPQENWADLGQVKLLFEVFKSWKAQGKAGYIINVGSIASLFPIRTWNSFQTFRIAKLALDQASFSSTRAFLNNQVPFRTSLIRLGRLDTPVARERDNWTGNGISLDYVHSSIKSLVLAPHNTCSYCLDMDVNLNYEVLSGSKN